MHCVKLILSPDEIQILAKRKNQTIYDQEFKSKHHDYVTVSVSKQEDDDDNDDEVGNLFKRNQRIQKTSSLRV